MRDGLVILALGLALGMPGAGAVARLLSGLLFGVSPTDPATFAVVAATMATVALGACALPARRASRLDPLAALRHE
jgi:ABC-type antimicrobial peptide transport system permease subunit